MYRYIIWTLILLAFCAQASAFELNQPTSVANLWHQAEQLSGPPEAMGQRSMLFHKLYLDSNRQMPFALSVSHLTLAIERSIDFGTLDQLPRFVPYNRQLKQDMNLWRTSLETMNQDMFRRTYFAWMYAKHLVQFDEPPTHSEKDLKLIGSVSSIVPVMMEIQKNSHHKISPEIKEQQTKNLIHWEHSELFQPQLEKVYQNLHWIMKMNLKMIPGPRLEKYLLEPLFQLRSTLSLQCFQNPNKKLRTRNFMDSEQRIQQAVAFYQEMSAIEFDPALFCYNDEYYLSYFPKEFFENPEEYLDQLSKNLLSDEHQLISLPSKSEALHSSYLEKLSVLRLDKQLRPQNICSIENFKFWKTYFSNLVDFPKSILKTREAGGSKRLGALEMGVARNSIINRAYVDLFLMHTQNLDSLPGDDIIPHSWLGSAAFGSASVGKQMLYGMYLKSKTSLADEFLDQFTEDDLKSVKKYMSGYSALYARVGRFLTTLAKANQAVFHDIFWQFFTAHLCGTDKVISVLSQSHDETDIHSLEAWKSFKAGDNLNANLSLLRVEQEFVLQPLLYNGLSAKYFSARGIFNKYALPGAPGPEGPLMNFHDYAEAHNIQENLSNLDSRMAWVNYLVQNHAQYFKQKLQGQQMEEIFSDLLRVNRNIFKYYSKVPSESH